MICMSQYSQLTVIYPSRASGRGSLFKVSGHASRGLKTGVLSVVRHFWFSHLEMACFGGFWGKNWWGGGKMDSFEKSMVPYPRFRLTDFYSTYSTNWSLACSLYDVIVCVLIIIRSSSSSSKVVAVVSTLLVLSNLAVSKSVLNVCTRVKSTYTRRCVAINSDWRSLMKPAGTMTDLCLSAVLVKLMRHFAAAAATNLEPWLWG